MRHNAQSDDQAHLHGDSGGREDGGSIECAMDDEKRGADSSCRAVPAVQRITIRRLSNAENQPCSQSGDGKDIDARPAPYCSGGKCRRKQIQTRRANQYARSEGHEQMNPALQQNRTIAADRSGNRSHRSENKGVQLVISSICARADRERRFLRIAKLDKLDISIMIQYYRLRSAPRWPHSLPPQSMPDSIGWESSTLS